MLPNDHSDEINRFELGLEILARLRESETSSTPQAPEPEASRQEDFQNSRLVVDRYQEQALAIHDILAELAPLPQHTLLIGPGEDGLPILINLTQPEPGSILITGSPDSGMENLLEAILTSGCATTSHRQLRYAFITPQPERLTGLGVSAHTYKVTTPHTNQSYELIVELANLVDERRYGQGPGPVIVLAIDDLRQLASKLDQEYLQLLLWVIKFGPASQVWTVATTDVYRLDEVKPEILDCFDTWLLGSLDGQGKRIALPDEWIKAGETLDQGNQFCLLYEGEWVKFRIPRI